MTHSSSSSASSSMEVVVSTMATFLVRGQAEEQGGRGGGFMKVEQDVAIWPFCLQWRQHPSLKHFSRSSRVSFRGFSLVSMSMALGSLEGTVLGVGVWKVTGVLEECCFAMEAANHC